MTPLGRSIITIGIGIFTACSLLWIILSDWRWFAGGAAIFFGALLSGAVLSAETKPTATSYIHRYRTPPLPPPPQPTLNEDNHSTRTTAPLPEWEPPSTPPPDKSDDPFRP